MPDMKYIGKIHTAFPEKFGLPRQSSLANSLFGEVVLEGEYADMRAVEGLDEYDYIWLLWDFDGVELTEFKPKVRPPRLGGNEFKGVFATRSPFRPNKIGMSCVKLLGVENRDGKPVLMISGIDMRDGTPIYDIKPYLPYVEAHPDARGGFTDHTNTKTLRVECSDDMISIIPVQLRAGLIELLSQDPRPAYQDDPDRVYGVKYGLNEDLFNIKFTVKGDIVEVTDIEVIS